MLLLFRNSFWSSATQNDMDVFVSARFLYSGNSNNADNYVLLCSLTLLQELQTPSDNIRIIFVLFHNPSNNIILLLLHKSFFSSGQGEAGNVRRSRSVRVPLLQVLGENRPLHHLHGQPQVHDGEKPTVLDSEGNRSPVQHRLTTHIG